MSTARSRQVSTKLKDSIERTFLFSKKLAWRSRYGKKGAAIPAFVLGVQRSGTTMLVDCLDQSPEIECYGEGSVAFDNARLRSLEMTKDMVHRSAHRVVVFKPLTDSHRANELLSMTSGAKAIWMYRRFEDRVNSSLARFGNNNLELFRALGKGEKLDSWQAQGLSDDAWKRIKSIDWEAASPHDAAAFFWYLRNDLYFQQALDQRKDVLLVNYENLVQQPEQGMRAICSFLECTFDFNMIRAIHGKSVGKRQAPEFREDIAELCKNMYERLNHAQA